MAISSASLMEILALALSLFACIASADIVEAPVPSPDSAAGAVSQSFVIGIIASICTFLLGSALKM